MPPEELAVLLSTQDSILSKLQSKTVDSIVAWFKSWKRYRALADEFLPQHESGMAINLIWAILQQHISPEEFDELVKGRGPETQIEQRIWIHGQTSAEKSASWRKGAEKSWGVVYSDREIVRIGDLRRDKKTWDEIAQILNEEIHSREPVRTSASLRKYFSRVKMRVGEIVN